MKSRTQRTQRNPVFCNRLDAFMRLKPGHDVHSSSPISPSGPKSHWLDSRSRVEHFPQLRVFRVHLLHFLSRHRGPFVEYRRARGIKTKSINNALGVVRRILNLAARSWRENDKTWLETAPLITMLHVTDARKPYPLSWREQEVLFRKLPAHLARMALFKVNTGTREQEVCQLRWDWEQHVVELNASVFVLPEGIVKNGEDRLIVLNDVAASVIESVRGEHPEFVFVTPPDRKGVRTPLANMNNSSWQRRRIDAALELMTNHPAFAGWEEDVSRDRRGDVVIGIAARRSDRPKPYRLRYSTGRLRS